MYVDLRKPGIQILLKKNVGRTAVSSSVPISGRYAGAGGVGMIRFASQSWCLMARARSRSPSLVISTAASSTVTVSLGPS